MPFLVPRHPARSPLLGRIDELADLVADDDIVPQTRKVTGTDSDALLLRNARQLLPVRGKHVALGEVVERLVGADRRPDLKLHVD